MDRLVVSRRIGRRLRWLLMVVGMAAAVGLVALFLPASGSLVVDTREIDTGAVVRAPFQDYLPFRAEIAPMRSVVVSAVAEGTVDTLDVADGVLVSKGATLVRFDNPALRLEVAAREVEIASRLTDLSAQELALRRTGTELDSTTAAAANEVLRADHELLQRQTLFDKGLLSPTALVPYQRDAAFRHERLTALQAADHDARTAAARQLARLAATRALLSVNLAAVHGELSSLLVRAPAAGRLTGFVLQPGQAVKAGNPLGQIDSEGAYKLIGEVDEFYLARLSPGQHATATIDSADAPLTVDRVLPQVAGGRFKIELAFAGAAPAGMRRGQTVDARITLGGAHGATVAPNGPWLDAGGTTAFVVDPGGSSAARRAITIGRRTPKQVEIAGGLHAGERIVTSGIAGYRTQTRLIFHDGDKP